MEQTRSIFILNYITWSLSAIFYAFQMTLRIMPIIMIDFLSRKIGLSPTELGFLAGVYYLGYSIAHIPLGICLDSYSPRYVIVLSILLCVSGIYLTMFAESPWEVYLSRFIIGIGSAGGILGTTKIISNFYPANFGLMLGFTVMIGVCGACFGAQPIREMLYYLSPEQVMHGLILFGIVLAASIWCLYVFKQKPTEKDADQTSVSDKVITAMKNKNFWLIGIFGGLMVGPLEGFADLWGIKYLTQVQGMYDRQAAISITMIFVGLGIGAPLLGFLSKQIFDLRRTIIFSGTSLTILLLVLFSGFTLTTETIYALCFLIGLLSAYQISVFTMVTIAADKNLVSISIAIVNMTIMIFGFIYHFVIGCILDSFTDPQAALLSYSTYAYQCSFSIILLGVIFGTMGFTFIKFIPDSKPQKAAKKPKAAVEVDGAEGAEGTEEATEEGSESTENEAKAEGEEVEKTEGEEVKPEEK